MGAVVKKQVIPVILFIGIFFFSTAPIRCRPDMSPEELTVRVDYRDIVGTFNRLSGAQGSPFPDVTGDREKVELFRGYHVSLCRFPQDCAPNSSTLAAIFPDGRVNPDDPAGYHFTTIDRHIAAAREAGCAILWQSSYDVGLSDRWVGINLGGRAPRDMRLWCRVVERCLEHFNNSWQGGFDYAVKYVEFVNEPNGLGGFRGEEAARLAPAFFDFLDMVERYNEKHPATQVKACGPGIPFSWDEWSAWEPRFRKLFLMMKRKKIALPVLSFHTYGKDTSPQANEKIARAYRRLLDEYDMRETELWNSEWQGGDFLKVSLGIKAPGMRREYSESERKIFAKGLATYALSCKIRWQGLLDGSSYYLAHMRAYPEDFEKKISKRTYAGMMFDPDKGATPLAEQERLTFLIMKQAPLLCRASLSRDDGLFAALGTRSLKGETISLLLCNLKAATRVVKIMLLVPGKTGKIEIGMQTLDGEMPFRGSLEKPSAEGGPWKVSLSIGPLESHLLIIR
jgi:hypothetical protein